MINTSIFSNEMFSRYLLSMAWEWQIGGKLGLHTDTVPKIWDGTRVTGAVPGISYITTFVDGYTNQVHKPNNKELNTFIDHAPIGTIIYQDIPVYQPNQEKITYECLWVKIDSNKWQYTKSIKSKGVDPRPWNTNPRRVI
jgi:hypothetical protein